MSMTEGRTHISEKLKNLGLQIYKQIEAGEYPRIKLPIRSVSNIIYDPEKGVVKLGEKTAIRSSANIRQSKAFARLMWVAAFAKTNLVDKGKSCSLRDLYYHSFNEEAIKFEEQDESDNVVVELEGIIGVPRETFNILPEEKSSIFGDLTIEYTTPESHAGLRVNLTSDPDGKNIGLSIATAKFIETSAKMVIAFEKGAMFRRFIEEGLYNKLNAILIDTGGQAPRFTRIVIRRLHEELGLPVYILTDADPWGMHIARVITSGSAQAAHIPFLATPNAKWVGIWATDIKKYELPALKLNAIDLQRLATLEKDPRYNEGIWAEQLRAFKKIGLKAELEAFSKYGLTAIIDRYILKKIKSMEKDIN